MAVLCQENVLLKENLNHLTLDVEYSGYAVTDQKWNGKQVCSPFNRLYILEEGSGVVMGGGETVTMVPGMIYLIPAGLSVSFYCPDAMRKYFFHLNLLKPDRYDLFLGFGKIGQLPFSKEQLQTLKSNFHGNHYSDVTAVKLQLYQILFAFLTAYNLASHAVPTYSEHVMDTISYIRENLSVGLQLDDLAKRRFISRSFLARLFRREVGVSLGQYITDQLMMEAQKRLDQTDASIGEISHSLGFGDQCYFSRRFKQVCGLTPLQYRKKSQTY